MSIDTKAFNAAIASLLRSSQLIEDALKQSGADARLESLRNAQRQGQEQGVLIELATKEREILDAAAASIKSTNEKAQDEIFFARRDALLQLEALGAAGAHEKVGLEFRLGGVEVDLSADFFTRQAATVAEARKRRNRALLGRNPEDDPPATGLASLLPKPPAPSAPAEEVA